MIRKSLSYLAITIISSALIPSLSAGPRFAGGEVTLQASAAITNTDRVAPNAVSSSDYYYTLTPSITYSRDSPTMDLQAGLSYGIRRYDRAERLNSENINFSLTGEVPFGANPKLTGNWNIIYSNGITADYYSNRNRDSESLNFGAYANYVLINKWSLRARTSYVDRTSSGIGTDFENSNHSIVYAFGAHGRELIRGRIGTYVEYQIRKRVTDQGEIEEGVDAKDEGLNFGVTGQLLPERLFPKLDADLSFGFNSTSGSDGFNSNSARRNRLSLDGKLSYPMNSKTDVSLGYNRSLTVTDDDRTVERSTVNLSVNYRPRQRLSFSAGIGTGTNDFIYDESERKDDIFTANLTTSYQIRSFWTAAFSFNYRNSSSNNFQADYSSQRATLSTTLSF